MLNQNVFGAEGINVNIGVDNNDLLKLAAVMIVSSVISGVIINLISK